MFASLKQAKVFAEKILLLEKRGEYEEAISELSDIWEDTAKFPNVDGLKRSLSAEIILRCGSLIGFLGHSKQIPDSQEKSKNLLTEARNRFLDIYDIEKIAECENYLALAYWRTGELKEAETWIEEALSHKLAKSSSTRLYCIVTKSLIYLSVQKYEENLTFCENYEADFIKYGDAFLNGTFCSNFGITLKNLGKTSEALNKFETAKRFRQEFGHKVYLGTVENNLAQVYRLEKKFTEAHNAVDNALGIYKRIKDKTRKGSSFDTKAKIYLAQRKFDDALKTVDKAIKILEPSENSAYLVEAYLTKTKILISQDDIPSATLCLFDAVQIARDTNGEESAKNLTKEFELALKETIPPIISKVFTEKEIIVEGIEDIKLVLPAEMSHYKEIQAVWIKNRHLETLGIKEGSLAIVVGDEEIKQGDLVAIAEIKDDLVSCGFYEKDFGFVCLEGVNSEPQLFNESEIKVLGKIIGVGESKNKDGKMKIRPILP